MKESLNKKYMRLAITEARKNLLSLYGGPFGACIVKGKRVIAIARNTVLRSDAIAHAEVNAICEASKKLKTFDLTGCSIYSTTEPCPMCFSAIHWAKIDSIAYGTSIRDVKKRDFNELTVSNARLKSIGKSKVKILSGFLRDECMLLLREWDRLENKKVY